MKRLIKRLICLFRGHRWEDCNSYMKWRGTLYYDGAGYRCQRCGKRSFYKPSCGKIKEDVI